MRLCKFATHFQPSKCSFSRDKRSFGKHTHIGGAIRDPVSIVCTSRAAAHREAGVAGRISVGVAGRARRAGFGQSPVRAQQLRVFLGEKLRIGLRRRTQPLHFLACDVHKARTRPRRIDDSAAEEISRRARHGAAVLPQSARRPRIQRPRSSACARSAAGNATRAAISIEVGHGDSCAFEWRFCYPAGMRIATWNVNSVRLRLPHLLSYLEEVSPDVLCLQEIKCQDEQFPRLEVESAGYNCAVHGQKGFNGVAILSKRAVEVTRGLPGDEEDVQSRYIEAIVPDERRRRARRLDLSAERQSARTRTNIPYKLAWMDRLIAPCAQACSRLEEPLVLAGDYNVMPDARDVYDPANWTRDAFFRTRDAREIPHAAGARLYRRACAPSPTTRGFTRSGIIRPAPGRKILACASTIACCRRTPRTGLPP